jgi:hypothetical protein
MADVIGQRIAGNLVYIDKSAHLKRVVGAVGPDVIEFFDDFTRSTLTGADAPLGATVTLVEGGAGETTIAHADAAGGQLLITTDAADNDGANIQWSPEAFKLASFNYFYFGTRLKVSDATQSDLFVGLAVTDTDLLGGVTDSIGFRKVDAATTLSVLVEKDSTETTAPAAATIGTSFITLELVHDGSTLEAFVDGASVGTVATTNLPDDEELRPSIHFLAGEAVAKTLHVDWIRVVQIGGRA